jgi:hypothetical protein
VELSWNNDIAVKLSQDVQSHDVFDYILDECKRADKMIIGSFAMNEAYVRRIIRNRERIAFIEVFLDLTVADRSPANSIYVSENVDALYLVNNHSKFIYCSGEKEMLAVMSNNATNNHRFEFQVFTTNQGAIAGFLDYYEKMKTESLLYESDR